jgi:hypothetical protein
MIDGVRVNLPWRTRAGALAAHHQVAVDYLHQHGLDGNPGQFQLDDDSLQGLLNIGQGSPNIASRAGAALRRSAFIQHAFNLLAKIRHAKPRVPFAHAAPPGMPQTTAFKA